MKWTHLVSSKHPKLLQTGTFAVCGGWFKRAKQLTLTWREATCPDCKIGLRRLYEVQNSHVPGDKVPTFESWSDHMWNKTENQQEDCR